MQEGDDYVDLRPAISICFLTDTMFTGTPEPHLRFVLCDEQRRVTLTDQLQVHTVELTKYNFEREQLAASDDLTRWSFFLRESPGLEASDLRLLLPQPAFVKATGIIEMIAHTPEERQRYEARRKAERDENWRLRIAEDRGQKLNQSQTVQKLQQALKLPVSSEADLLKMDVAELNRLGDELIARLQNSATS